MSAPVHIEPYDPAWPAQFELERHLLLGVLAEWLVGPIEHIGSTSVLGLAAKPVIDIMAGVGSLQSSLPAIPLLARHGYCYSSYKTDVMHWFCKPSPEIRTHHLHLVPFESELWHERLAFRDALRSQPDLAREYERLKRELAEKHRQDREAYTEAKSPFIANALRRGRERRDTAGAA
jgi:GrpB-like predicted nucleotidyltransferase (UPF0157 family)